MYILIKSIRAGAALCTSLRVTNANAESISAKIPPCLPPSLSPPPLLGLGRLYRIYRAIIRQRRRIAGAINPFAINLLFVASQSRTQRNTKRSKIFRTSSEVRSEVAGQWPMITSGVVFAGRPRHFARRFVKRFGAAGSESFGIWTIARDQPERIVRGMFPRRSARNEAPRRRVSSFVRLFTRRFHASRCEQSEKHPLERIFLRNDAVVDNRDDSFRSWSRHGYEFVPLKWQSID